MTDYERETAREWQQIGEVRPSSRPRGRRLAAAAFEPDTAARTAWRTGEAPILRYSLPKDFVPQRQQSRGRRWGRSTSPNSLPPELQRIELLTETEIVQHMETKGRGPPAVMLLIWGSPERARAAQQSIDEWVRSYIRNEGSASRSWAKPVRKEFESKVREEEEKQKYRRNPPNNAIFPAAGKFEWDPDFDSPEEVLGANLEALDPLRIELSSYVKSVPHQKALSVMGEDPDKVQRVLIRLRGTFFQAIARVKANNTATLYLLQGLDGKDPVAEITYRSVYRNDGPTPSEGAQKRLGAAPCLEEGKISHKKNKHIHDLQAKRAAQFRKAVRKALATGKYFRGNLQMTVTFGVFLLDRYRRNVDDVEGFEVMMEDENVAGAVFPGCSKLGPKVLSYVARYRNSYNSVQAEEPIEIPEPTYSASFLMKHKSDYADLRLDVEFSYDQMHDQVDCPVRRWCKYIYGPDHPVKLLDCCLIDVENDSDAWGIELAATETVFPTERTLELMDFGASVDLNKAAALSRRVGDCFIKYDAKPGVILHKMIQRTHRKFVLGDTGYYVDVAQEQEFQLAHPDSKVPDQRDIIATTSPIGKVSVYRQEWASILAENAKLKVGEGVSGNFSISKFFPSVDGTHLDADVESFFRILNELRDVIRGDADEKS